MTTRTRIVLLAVVAVAFGAPGTAQAQTRLNGVVGPSFSISLTDANGAAVTQLNPGTYQIVVDDRSAEHNFHLTGPGIDMRTNVDFIGQVTWTVTLVEGRYQYVCDPHLEQMRGEFVAGNPPAPPPPPPPLLLLLLLLRPRRLRRRPGLRPRSHACSRASARSSRSACAHPRER